MAGNFLKYGASDATFGSKNPGDIPVDAHEFDRDQAAPRLTFVSHGYRRRATRSGWIIRAACGLFAQPVFRLLGAKDLGRDPTIIMSRKRLPVKS